MISIRISAYIQSKTKVRVLFLCFCIQNSFVFSQEGAPLKNEKVNVVKAYTPTINEAQKIKSKPIIADSIIQNKKELRYSIFSVPVASTFSPVKGRAAGLVTEKKPILFDNYATFGMGNFASVLAEFYSNFQVNSSDNVGLYLHHNSSQGGIDEVQLKDYFYNSFLDLNYTSRKESMSYGLELGVEHQVYNWYGVPESIFTNDVVLNSINPTHHYYGGKVGGKLQIKKGIFNKMKFRYRYFGDNFNAQEHRLFAQPTFQFGVQDHFITTDIEIDYVSGNFDNDTAGLARAFDNSYGTLNIGIRPSFKIDIDQLELQLGGSVFYSVDDKSKDVDIYIYPMASASYSLLDQKVIIYGGLKGGLQQITYRDATQANPYVAPNLPLTPTHNQYDGYIGLKGKLSDILGYTIKGSYRSESNKPLFFKSRGPVSPALGFEYGNSFSYRYDKVNTFSAYGELNIDINKKFRLGATGTYSNYNTAIEVEAWNLPDFEAAVLMNYQINSKWFSGAQLFYVGERKDISNSRIVTLDSFLDANINVGYRFNQQLSFFLKGNNLIGANYERWLDVPVQGIQVLGGLTYKFDY